MGLPARRTVSHDRRCGRERNRSDERAAADNHGGAGPAAAEKRAAAPVSRSRPRNLLQPEADRIHGAPRHPGALSRLVWRRLLDGSESADPDGHVLFRVRSGAAWFGPEPHWVCALFPFRYAALAGV